MKKAVLIGIGVVAGIAVLAVAAFMAMRMLNPQAANGEGDMLGGPGLLMTGNAGKAGMGAAPVQIRLEVANAEEIPERTPEARGLIMEIKDTSLMVSTDAKVGMMVSEGGGPPQTNVETSGALTEVVITKETLIYADTTFSNYDMEEGLPKEDEPIQQTVELISISDIENENFVSVWGYKRGDRLIAEVILYTEARASIFKAQYR